MKVSVERLRIWVLVGVGLLVLLIGAFLGYARYRVRHLVADLPQKLGIDVTNETDAFTYSQSNGSKTLYTIHAAKAIQHKDGKTAAAGCGDCVVWAWGCGFEEEEPGGDSGPNLWQGV